MPKKVKKKGKGKVHHHCPAKKGNPAGNPLDPNDKTIGNKFWSA